MVIRTFSAQASHQTLSDVAARTGLTRAGARRILLTLEELGYVSVDGRHFRLTAKVLDLAAAFLASTPAWSQADAILRALLDADHLSATLNTLDGADLVVVSRVPAQRPRPQRHDTGTRLPALRTAAGLVMAAVYPDRVPQDLRHQLTTVTDPGTLAALSHARAHGFARITDGIYPGLTTVSVPLSVKRDEPWAITVAGLTELMPPVGAEGPLVQRMRRAAETLSAS